MRYGLIPEGAMERVGLAAGMVPEPMLEPYGLAFARAVVIATHHGIFEALENGPRSAAEVAAARELDPHATEKLMSLLTGMRHLHRAADGRYRLSRSSRRWLLASSPRSIRDMVLMKALEFRWLDHLEGWLRTGEPLDVHGTMSPDDWRLYQRGMRAQAGLIGPWLARRMPVPAGATSMLDIGGSHGYLSVVLCRRHPGLRSVVLDLPAAIGDAAPLLAAEGMGDRVVHRAGDVLTDDLGTEAYDLIVAFSLVHHFDDATNRRLAARCAAALKPGGHYVIGDLMRPGAPERANGMDLFYDLYFALTSRSGLWTFDEMADWQRAAGLEPRRPLRILPGMGPGLQVGVRPAA